MLSGFFSTFNSLIVLPHCLQLNMRLGQVDVELKSEAEEAKLPVFPDTPTPNTPVLELVGTSGFRAGPEVSKSTDNKVKQHLCRASHYVMYYGYYNICGRGKNVLPK